MDSNLTRPFLTCHGWVGNALSPSLFQRGIKDFCNQCLNGQSHFGLQGPSKCYRVGEAFKCWTSLKSAGSSHCYDAPKISHRRLMLKIQQITSVPNTLESVWNVTTVSHAHYAFRGWIKFIKSNQNHCAIVMGRTRGMETLSGSPLSNLPVKSPPLCWPSRRGPAKDYPMSLTYARLT